MLDVLIVGAGPAGAVTAAILARAGLDVRLLDRATFPRDKLCGDTVNPGTLAVLRRLQLATGIERRGLRVDGMRVTGESGGAPVSVTGLYPPGACGRALVRRELDAMLVADALAAGAQFEPGVAVQRAIVDAGRVLGVTIGTNGTQRELRARVTIAADGRRSRIAFGLGLARHPDRPRRWAIGAYFENVLPDAVAPAQAVGEMHVRTACYVGVAPVPGGLTNVCLVVPSQPGDPHLRDPAALLQRELARDAQLRDRFSIARMVPPAVVLGPLAVEVAGDSLDGLLLAGDAAGFIDPITGDGLGFAIRGAELVAAGVLEALEHGWTGVHRRLAVRLRAAFAAKWRFNRVVRALVGSPRGVRTAAFGARVAPAALRAAIAYAGDCGRA